MSIIKRGSSSTTALVASSVFTCSSCDHVEMVRSAMKGMTCPKCANAMKMISCQCSSEVDPKIIAKPSIPSSDK